MPVERGIKIAISRSWGYASHVAVILAGAVVGDFINIFRTNLTGELLSPSWKWLFIEAGAVLLWLLWNAYSVLIARLAEIDWRRARNTDALTWMPLLLLSLYSHNHLVRELFGGVYYGAAYIILISFPVLVFKVMHVSALVAGRKWAVATFVAVIAGVAFTMARFGLTRNLFTWLETDVLISIQLVSAAVVSVFVIVSGGIGKRPGKMLKGAIAASVFFAIWWSFSSPPKHLSPPGPEIADPMPEALPMTLFAKGGPVKRVRLKINDELRDAILFTRPGEVSQKLDIVPGTKLAFGAGVAAFGEFQPESVLNFKLYVDSGGQKKNLWTRELNPKQNPADREWIDSTIDLTPYAGPGRILTFQVEGGPFGAISRPTLVREDESSGQPPNVVVVLLDTVRADHVGAYGYRRNTTPFIDEVARTGTMFRKTVSTAAWTEPATFTLLTGMIPAQANAEMFTSVIIPNDVDFLSEILERRGYRTAAVSGNYYITISNNFAQGFETYNEQCLPYFHWRSAECVTDKALQWADQNHGKPFFLYLHYVDPHSRYNAPPPYHEKFSLGYTGADPRIKLGETMEFELMYERSGKRIALPEEDRRYLIDLYDGEIAYADAQIRRLFDGLKERGLLKNTVVVITSDHGEEFTEHGMLGHRLNLHGTLLDVPLVFWDASNKGLIPAGAAVDEQVSLADVMPTLLDLIGIKPSSYCWGRSLAPLWKGQELPPRVCFAQRRQMFLREWAIADDRYKFIVEVDGKKNQQWYDMIADSLEFNNISPDPAIKQELQKQLTDILNWIEAHKIRWAGPAQRLDEEEKRKRIKVMGY